jgi:hypothetical protein
MIAIFIVKRSESKAATLLVACRADARDANPYRIYFLYKFRMDASKCHKDFESPFGFVPKHRLDAAHVL